MTSATTTPPALIARSFPQRLGIFVDVQNMFYSAKLLHQSKVDYGRLLREITGTRHLVRAIAYIVQKPDVNQAGFHEALSRFGYELKIKELKIRPDSDRVSDRSGGGGGGTAKGSWEIGLTIDALMMAPRLDTVTLVTGDGDYVPLVECLKLHGCRVEVVSFERSTAGELIRAADAYIPIQESWIFKEKKFEAAAATPGSAPAAGPTHGYEGLPRDEDLEAEAAAAAAAEQSAAYGNNAPGADDDEDPPQPPPPPSRGSKRPDLGILA
jgi:uncharacterized LabA/DUF88 family protein